jgi:alkanesulfonate monooxygenase
MTVSIGGREVRVFAINPQTRDLDRYWREVRTCIHRSAQQGWTGVLLFTGNDTYVEPWLAAQYALAQTESSSPLVAVNPVYMHPYSAAKMVSSLTHLYGRKIYLNMVCGIALSHLDALGDNLSHDERYERLGEYIAIMQSLLSGKPVSFDGRYYRVSHLRLLPAVPAESWPDFLLAGQSEAAQRVCERVGAIGMRMLQPALERAHVASRGISFGIVARATREAAWNAARALFPADREAQELLDMSMSNTDSSWKRRLHSVAHLPERTEDGYWLGPFRNFQADCPYFVGSYSRTADLLRGLAEKGVDFVVLDIPAQDEEYEHVGRAFALATARMSLST